MYNVNKCLILKKTLCMFLKIVMIKYEMQPSWIQQTIMHSCWLHCCEKFSKYIHLTNNYDGLRLFSSFLFSKVKYQEKTCCLERAKVARLIWQTSRSGHYLGEMRWAEPSKGSKHAPNVKYFNFVEIKRSNLFHSIIFMFNYHHCPISLTSLIFIWSLKGI